MAQIRTAEEISYIARAGRIVSACHRELRKLIVPGVSTMDIEHFVEDFIREKGGKPAQKGYMGFPYATCASVNDEICHGFPDNNPLIDGDIVKIDMVVDINGWMADSAWSYAVGEVPDEMGRLMRITKKCLYMGIAKAVPGARTGDIANAVQNMAESEGYSVVRDYTGHGIGTLMHDGLIVPHWGPAGKGARLVEGMVLTIEPMLNTGTYKTMLDSNGWTAKQPMEACRHSMSTR
jgi:methionyl aminopeptidase